MPPYRSLSRLEQAGTTFGLVLIGCFAGNPEYGPRIGA